MLHIFTTPTVVNSIKQYKTKTASKPVLALNKIWNILLLWGFTLFEQCCIDWNQNNWLYWFGCMCILIFLLYWILRWSCLMFGLWHFWTNYRNKHNIYTTVWCGIMTKYITCFRVFCFRALTVLYNITTWSCCFSSAHIKHDLSGLFVVFLKMQLA